MSHNTISLEVSIPCIGSSFGNRNFYSRQEGQIDLNDIDSIAENGREVIERIDSMAEKVYDPELESARKKAELAANIDSQADCDAEDVQKANNELLDAKKLIDKTRQANLSVIRQMDLDSCVEFFNSVVRQYAKSGEQQSFDNLTRTAQRSIDRNDTAFDNILDGLKTKSTMILIRQDWFIVDWYQRATAKLSDYIDITKFNELKKQGDQALAADDIDQLRKVLFELLSIKIHSDSGDSMFDIANILRG